MKIKRPFSNFISLATVFFLATSTPLKAQSTHSRSLASSQACHPTNIQCYRDRVQAEAENEGREDVKVRKAPKALDKAENAENFMILFGMLVGIHLLVFFVYLAMGAGGAHTMKLCASSFALLAASIFGYFAIKNSSDSAETILSDFEEEYKEGTNSYTSQEEAFNFLEKEQDAVKKAAIEMKGGFTTMAGMHATTAAVALAEIALPFANIASPCSKPIGGTTPPAVYNDPTQRRPLWYSFLEVIFPKAMASQKGGIKQLLKDSQMDEKALAEFSKVAIKHTESSYKQSGLSSPSSFFSPLVDLLFPKAEADLTLCAAATAFNPVGIATCLAAIVGSVIPMSYFNFFFGSTAAAVSSYLAAQASEQAVEAEENVELIRRLREIGND